LHFLLAGKPLAEKLFSFLDFVFVQKFLHYTSRHERKSLGSADHVSQNLNDLFPWN